MFGFSIKNRPEKCLGLEHISILITVTQCQDLNRSLDTAVGKPS